MRFSLLHLETAAREKKTAPTLSSVSSRGWWPVIREAVTGAWQRNVEYRAEDVLTYAAVYACATMIAADIGKLRIKLVRKDAHGIWVETENAAHSPVLRKPNSYQTRIKFLEQWVISKLVHGNTYVLKARDDRNVVAALYVLDAQRVQPLVASDGAVYYKLDADNLSRIPNGLAAVPASEIIHDVMVPLYHPLCGVSPITACGLAALQGLRIQANSERFFANGSQPGGILTAPGVINDEERNAIDKWWSEEYAGQDNTGRVAVLGNGLKYEKLSVNAVDAQLIEQLKWSAENVCMAFKMPPFKVGVSPTPSTFNVESTNIQYYSQCLQNPIESIEALLDEGLELKDGLGTELDLDDLLRMDTQSLVKTAAEAIGGGGMSPNEARARFLSLGPVAGGDHPYLQQQNFSLEAMARRDAQQDPFASAPARVPNATTQEPSDAADEKDVMDLFRKELRMSA